MQFSYCDYKFFIYHIAKVYLGPFQTSMMIFFFFFQNKISSKTSHRIVNPPFVDMTMEKLSHDNTKMRSSLWKNTFQLR